MCNVYSDVAPPLKATICHRTGGGSNTTWSAFLNGSLLNTVDIATLPTSAALSVFAGNEIHGNVSGTPSRQARYGSGSFPWQRYTASDCVGAVTVQVSTECDTDDDVATGCVGGAWEIEDLPSPFRIWR